MQDFSERVAVVTGAAAGIGRAYALALALRGAAVAVVDVDEAGIQETVNQIESAGGSSVAVRADVASEDEVERAVERIVVGLGGIDGYSSDIMESAVYTRLPVTSTGTASCGIKSGTCAVGPCYSNILQ